VMLVVLLATLALGLSACGGPTTYSWPGLAVSGETVFLAYNQHIAAVNVNNGTQIWKYPGEPDSKLMFYSNPWIDGQGNLAAGSYYGSVVYLKAQTGELIWKYEGGNTKIYAPVLETDNKLIASSEDGNLHFINPADGSLIRKISIGQSSWGAMAADARTIYVATLEHFVYAFNIVTGEKQWQYDAGTSIAGGVTLAGDKLLVGTFGKQVVELDAATGAEIRKIDADGWVWGAPVVDSGVMYFADLAGVVRAVSLEDGKELWRVAPGKTLTDTTPGKPITNALLVNNGRVILGSDDGKVRALSASTGSQLWEASFEGGVHGAMAILGDKLLVTLASGSYPLVALSLDNGALVWKFEGVK
jgi:eukaryotic-like serine/threonine-protein kinase